FTLEALVNLNQITMQDFISRYHQGVGQYSLGTGSEADHSLGSATTRYFNSYCSNPSVWWVFSTTAPQAQQWYHVATTYDGQTLSLYVDGQLQRSASWGGPNPDPHNNTLIGARFTSDGTPQIQFNGRLAYARMWNVCRTAEEIQESINTNPLNAEGLAANFDFGSMTDAPEPSAQEVPRQDLTYQNAVTLKGNAAITTFIQPITLESAQQVPPTPDTDQFTTYEAPEITPELRANFSKLASSISPKAFGDPLSDANLKAFLDEYNGALPANISAEQRQQMQAAYQQKITDLFEKARQGGLDGIRGDRYVKWVSEGDQQVLRYYEPGASHEVLRVASRDATPQEMWLLEFLATLIIGFLAVLGIYVNGGAIAKLGAFLLKESKVVTRIVAIISTGAAITATSILEVVDYLFVSGYLKKIIMIVAKLSFWTLSAFLLSLAVTIFAPEARVPQMLAAFALLAVHLVVLALEYPTENKAAALD
ncbi:MAG TPA: LamG domain-containing protein, partial [Bordetella sp.]|nr:LamG domain-containing protein [Bordetella sp.]